MREVGRGSVFAIRLLDSCPRTAVSRTPPGPGSPPFGPPPGVPGFQPAKIKVIVRAHIRYAGTDTPLVVKAGTLPAMKSAFEKAHKARFGFIDRTKQMVVEAVSVEAVGVAVLIGLLIGAVSAYYGGWIDTQRILESGIACPHVTTIIQIIRLVFQ